MDDDLTIAQLLQGKLNLADLPDDDRDNLAYVMAAIERDGYNLQHASARLQNHNGVVRAAVTRHGWALQYADPRLRDDFDTVLAAVGQEGTALKLASESLKRNPTIVAEALCQNGWALQYADASFQDMFQYVLMALQSCCYAIKFASPRLQHDPVVALTCLLEWEEHSKNVLRVKNSTLPAIDPSLLQSPAFAGRCLEAGLNVETIAELSGDFVLALTQYLLTRPTEQLQHTQHEGALLPCQTIQSL